MKRIRFLMLGGFLGAGKTTAIARLARHHMAEGKNVALVTNDQAYDLVDTHSLRAQGFDVGEVPGACFCCKFDDLVNTMDSLGATEVPDIVIAEPVGSCTDLVATVIEPMRQLYAEQIELGPLVVLLKPEHGRKILRDEGTGFSPKAAYIFLKQIEEADAVAINKIDKLSENDQSELVALVKEKFPDKEVFGLSARDGSNFEQLVHACEQTSRRREAMMDVDYDIYAEGEAELGWLNCQIELHSDSPDKFSLDETVVELVRGLKEALVARAFEPAHLKILGQAGGDAAVANLVGSGVDVELSLASEIATMSAELIVNARVAGDAETLEQLVREAVSRQAGERRLRSTITGVQRFQPARPNPTHRVLDSE